MWRRALGTIEDMAGLPLEVGTPTFGGPIATSGDVIFIASTMDYYLRALSTATGEELWRGRLPTSGNATPMTYLWKGRQYVVIYAVRNVRDRAYPWTRSKLRIRFRRWPLAVIVEQAWFDARADLLNNGRAAKSADLRALGQRIVVDPAIQKPGRVGVAGAGRVDNSVDRRCCLYDLFVAVHDHRTLFRARYREQVVVVSERLECVVKDSGLHQRIHLVVVSHDDVDTVANGMLERFAVSLNTK